MLLSLILFVLSQPVSVPLLSAVAQAEQTSWEKGCAVNCGAASYVVVRTDMAALKAQRITVALPGGGFANFGNPPLVSPTDDSHLTRYRWGSSGTNELLIDFSDFIQGQTTPYRGELRWQGRFYYLCCESDGANVAITLTESIE